MLQLKTTSALCCNRKSSENKHVKAESSASTVVVAEKMLGVRTLVGTTQEGGNQRDHIERSQQEKCTPDVQRSPEVVNT